MSESATFGGLARQSETLRASVLLFVCCVLFVCLLELVPKHMLLLSLSPALFQTSGPLPGNLSAVSEVHSRSHVFWELRGDKSGGLNRI
jgi:hypothetical protein